ncbi:hypothetical protein ACOMHN_064780, partial [Nucella lapillus]
AAAPKMLLPPRYEDAFSLSFLFLTLI